jgi:hypothetical protein
VLSPKAQKLNRLYIDRLHDLFGTLPATAITRPVVARLRETECYCTRLLSKLRLVLQHSVDTGMLRINPDCETRRRKAPSPPHDLVP